MKKLTLAAVAAFAFALAACAGTSTSEEAGVAVGEVNASAEITMQNWITHPKIVAVRKAVEEIEAARFAPETKKLCEDAGHGEFDRTKMTDAHLTVRKLVIGTGSDDSAGVDSYYYDAAGTLRFAFLTYNNVHGGKSELRVYFDESGKLLWEVSRSIWDPTFKGDITKAPYEPTEDAVVLDDLAKTPGKWFDAPPRCD